MIEMKDKLKEAMLRAWCEYRGMEYVEGYVNPLPSDNFEKGFMAGFKACENTTIKKGGFQCQS